MVSRDLVAVAANFLVRQPFHKLHGWDDSGAVRLVDLRQLSGKALWVYDIAPLIPSRIRNSHS